ncbi:MAG: hypothetical protein AABP62_30670, partial [Planctomycetota bacterium]
MTARWTQSLLACVVLVAIVFVARGHSDETPAKPKAADVASERAGLTDSPAEVTPPKKLFKGKVVKVHEALKRRGVKAYPEELKDQVVLETKDELIPILPDWRGRA